MDLRSAQRIAIAGSSATGKTTLCRWVADSFGHPRVEIDALHWGPNWLPRAEFARDVAVFVQRDRWVCEYQYPVVQPLIGGRIELLIFLQFPRRTVMRRLIGRTIKRRSFRTPLWGVNVEAPLHTLLTNRDHIMRWVWRSYPKQTLRIAALKAQRPDLTVVTLRNPRAVRKWKRALTQ